MDRMATEWSVDSDSRANGITHGRPRPSTGTACHSGLGRRSELDGPAGQVVQVREIPADALDAKRLSEMVSAFADTARAWRLIVQGSASAPGAALEPGVYLGIRI